MIKKIKNILSSQEILDKSFKKAKKKQINDKNALYKKKKTIIAQTESFSMSVYSILDNYIKNFPSLNNLPTFYQELIDIKIDINNLRKSLGAINWAKNTCNLIYKKQNIFLKKSNNINFLKQKQNEIYGRISSVINQIEKDLNFLIQAQKIINNFPEILDIPTVVITGFPNVGKSSLLKSLSKSKPRIAQYPFTTKEIYVGHIEKIQKFIKKRIQLIDTPGLLDNLSIENNEIEKQAIAALTHLSDLIIYIFDLSETCGYFVKDQKKLLKDIKKIFDKSKIIVIENKSDLFKSNSTNLKISNKTGDGIESLKKEIFAFFNI
jgi:nucleolar GTP-binding protein